MALKEERTRNTHELDNLSIQTKQIDVYKSQITNLRH
jgi:hypothetical protein